MESKRNFRVGEKSDPLERLKFDHRMSLSVAHVGGGITRPARNFAVLIFRKSYGKVEISNL